MSIYLYKIEKYLAKKKIAILARFIEPYETAFLINYEDDEIKKKK